MPLAVVAAFVAFSCCSCRQQITQFDHPKKLSLPPHFNAKALAIVKNVSGEAPERLYVLNGQEHPVALNGICVPVSEDQAETMLWRLRAKLCPLGYLVFWSEQINNKPSEIGIIKSADKYEIIRLKQTAGPNYDIDNARLIAKLKDWDKRYGIDIMGADTDWVRIRFLSLPKDLRAFAQEVHDFSPDVIDQGVNQDIDCPEDLVASIRKTKRLYLWWR